MSTQYPFTANDNYKSESVLDSTVMVEDGVVWDQEEVQVALNYTNDTITENNNDGYLTANESSNDTQYFSVLETTNEAILNDLNDITTVCNNDTESETTEDQPPAGNMCTIGGQPDIYRIEGSDELYAFEIACDEEGMIQRFRYRLRPNENGDYETVPESIELLPLESEPENDPSQIHPAEVPEHERINSEPAMERNAKIFVKEEYLHEQNVILPDIISTTLEESNPPEDSGDELQVNEDDDEMMYEEQSIENEMDSKAGIIEHGLLPVNKIEAIRHFKSEETSSTFDETLLEQPQQSDISPVHTNANSSIQNDEVHVSIHAEDSENYSQMYAPSDHEENESDEEGDTTVEQEQPRYELLISESDPHEEDDTCANLCNNKDMHKPFIPELDDSTPSPESYPSEDSNDHFETQHNMECLKNMNENDSDIEDFHIVDGVHVTADTESRDETSHVIEALIEREQPLQHQILKLQQQIPVLQSTVNDVNAKKMLNKNMNKVNKGFMYYVVKHPEKENVATIAHHTVANKVVKTNPRSVLKSSYSYFDQKKEKEKLPVQKIEKKLVKNKEAFQARVFHNFIANTKILHAPVRQQRLPRKQTIKPVERADEEIIVQEVVVSSNGFIETSEGGVVKSKVPLKPTEIVQLSDSDDDYDPKREHKRKKKQKKRKLRVPEIVISDSEDEVSDENVVQIDLSADSDEELTDNKKTKDQESDVTEERVRRTSQKAAASAEVAQSTSSEGDSTVKKKRGRPPKRHNSTNNENSVTDESSSSKKQRRNTKDSLDSDESSESKSEEQTSNANLGYHNIKTKWKCTQCPKTFPSQGSLKSHMQYHNFHEPNNRNLRQSTNKQESSSFKKPEASVSLPKNKYQCSVCKETFKNNVLLMRHRKEHSSGKHLECSICRKVFIDRLQLNNHKRTHIKEQMFKTTTLPKHSPKSTNTIKKKPFKSPGKINNYKCSFCTKVYTTLTLLNAHTRTHKKFTCSTCAASFVSKLVLEKHVRQNCVKQAKSPVRRPSLTTRKSFLAPPQRVSKRISLRRSLGKSGVPARNTSTSSSASDREKKRISLKPASLSCDKCTMKFTSYKALFSHKVVKHGFATPDKRAGASNTNERTVKVLGKHSSVPVGEKLGAILSRTIIEK